jgi:hypothetical protein
MGNYHNDENSNQGANLAVWAEAIWFPSLWVTDTRVHWEPVDEHTALLAGATPDQVAAMLEQLDRKQRLDWQQPPFADVNQLLPKQADWRAFFSPHGYTTWKSRESAAIVGTEVIGGPIVKEFPAAPPIGIAGGVTSGEFWMDIAMPADTMCGAGVYLQPKRRVRLQR